MKRELDMAAAERAPLTPQQRLSLSRRALVRQLNGVSEPHEDQHYRPTQAAEDELEYAHTEAAAALPPLGEPSGRPAGLSGNVWFSMGRSVVQRWWQRHPAQAVGQLARPLLESYARKQPAKLMAIAAAAGGTRLGIGGGGGGTGGRDVVSDNGELSGKNDAAEVEATMLSASKTTPEDSICFGTHRLP
jgi:hypothetical protein